MDPAALSKTLLDIGGWGAFLMLVIGAGIGFIKGWIVPGKYYEREVLNVTKASEAAEQNRKALEAMTKVLEDRRDQMDTLVAELVERRRRV